MAGPLLLKWFRHKTLGEFMNSSIGTMVQKSICLNTIRKLIINIDIIIHKNHKSGSVTSYQKIVYRKSKKNRPNIFILPILKYNYFGRTLILGLVHSYKYYHATCYVLYTRKYKKKGKRLAIIERS